MYAGGSPPDQWVGTVPMTSSPPDFAAGITWEKAAYALIEAPSTVPYMLAFGGTDVHDQTLNILGKFDVREYFASRVFVC